MQTQLKKWTSRNIFDEKNHSTKAFCFTLREGLSLFCKNEPTKVTYNEVKVSIKFPGM